MALLWPRLLEDDLEISFAHQSFKWTNNAKSNAGVTCVIIGISNKSNRDKYLFDNGRIQKVSEINAYLTAAPDIYISRRSKPLSELPAMLYGSEPRENGNLLLDKSDVFNLLDSNPEAEKFIKPITGSNEFINGIERWCLWIKDSDIKEAKNIPFIQKRLSAVSAYRITSERADTVKYAELPHKFTSITHRQTPSIIVPIVSSERRTYIPMGFLDGNTIVLNSAQVIYGAEADTFGLISSKMHMVWVRATAGALETRIRYSSAICYNNFPVPILTKTQRTNIAHAALSILSERERYSERTLAELYDPEKMPDSLKEAHHSLDASVERCYRSRPFTSDEERLEYLFRLYKAMASGENPQGELL